MFKDKKEAFALFNNMIGVREQFDLRHRIFNGVLLISLASTIIAISWNSTIGILTNTIAPLVLSIVGLIMGILYHQSKVKKRIYASTYAFTILLGISVLWLNSEGIQGSTPYLYMAISVVFTAISKGRKYLYYYALLVLNISVLLWIEFYYPNLIGSYPSENQKYLDLVFTLIVCLLVVAVVVALFRNNYDQEHTIVEEQKLELEKANAAKDKMFSIVSHDLRSPFQGILGISKLMMSQEVKSKPENFQKYIEALHLSVENATDLMENLLNWSKIQMNRIEVRSKSLNLADFFEKNALFIYHEHIEKKVKLYVRFDKNHRVVADEDMLNLIFRNLLSNAFKFTEVNGIITLESKIKDNFCEISVSDSGIGMSAEQIAEIFTDRFNKGQFGLQGEKSSGLGLMLTREFVEMQGGSIHVVSELGKGSTFIFTLPLD